MTKPKTPSVTLRNLFITRTGLLVLSLLFLELVGGMQIYLGATLLPLVGEELDAKSLFGLILAVSNAAFFLTIPLGPTIVAKFGVSKTFLVLTIATIFGNAMAAFSPNIYLYLVSKVVSGMAGGALVTVSVGVVAKTLNRQWRQMTLGLMAAMWLLASIIGPAYGGVGGRVFGWRLTLIIYLPLLLVALLIVNWNLKGRNLEKSRTAFKIQQSLLLSLGMLLVSGLALPEAFKLISLGVGLALVGAAMLWLMPKKTFTLASPRRSSLVFIMVITSIFLGIDEAITIMAHNFWGIDSLGLGLVIAAGGLGWSAVGIVLGKRPAKNTADYHKRGLAGLILLASSLTLALIFTQLAAAGSAELLLGLAFAWIMGGAGVGLAYTDTINLVFTNPDRPDGIDADQAVTAAMLAETAGTAIVASILGTYVSNGFGVLTPNNPSLIWPFLSLIALIPLALTALYKSRVPGYVAQNSTDGSGE